MNSLSQILKDMPGIGDFKDDQELVALFKEMNKFTYAFCQIETHVEPGKSGKYKKISDRYNIIGIMSSTDAFYARKIVLERVLVRDGKNLYDSIFKISTLLNKKYNKDKAWGFFVTLNSYGFDKLDDKCLMNKLFPSPDHPGQMQWLELSDTQNERLLLSANQKIRRINCYAPEYIFTRRPDLNVCRAIYIICRNRFIDTIWQD